MKRLREFEYYEPASLDEAVQLLSTAGDGARVLAGGTDLVVDMKTGRMRPSTVVNLKGISGLSGVEDDGGGTRIGALTKVPVLEASPLVQQRHPALAQAASILASPPVRALATIGGNVGRASPASDLGPALIVHDAHAIICRRWRSSGRTRGGLCTSGPAKRLWFRPTSSRTSSCSRPPPGFGSAHVKLGKRGSGTDIALAGVSASVVIGERWRDRRLSDRPGLTRPNPISSHGHRVAASLQGADRGAAGRGR